MPDPLSIGDAAARRVRFEELTAAAQLDRFKRIQATRPLCWDEMRTVERLLARQERRRARLKSRNPDLPAHRRGIA